jgi:hypothetical protein
MVKLKNSNSFAHYCVTMPVAQYAVQRRRQRGGNFRGKKYQRGKQEGGFLGKLLGLGGGGGGGKQKAQPINLNVNQRQSNSMNANRRKGSMYYGPRPQQPYYFRTQPDNLIIIKLNRHSTGVHHDQDALIRVCKQNNGKEKISI